MRLTFALACAFALAGCASREAPSPDVVATFYPLKFIAARIGGDNVTVESLVPPGVEPHEYEPTTLDARKIEDSKLLVLQGAGFESWAGTIRGGAPRVVATEGIPLNGFDPHTWLDPVLYAKMSEGVERGMSEAFPQHNASFHARAQALRADLAALDREYAAGLAHCTTPFVVTNHAAFAYMAARYNFTMIAISGLEPEAEPDPQTMARVADEARAHNATVVFFEDLVSPKVAEAIAREVGARTDVLSPVESVAGGADYLSVMRGDLAKLREAMRCG